MLTKDFNEFIELLNRNIINQPDGVNFKECYPNREETAMEEGISINYIQFSDLIANKRASGRHKDLDDIINLSQEP